MTNTTTKFKYYSFASQVTFPADWSANMLRYNVTKVAKMWKISGKSWKHSRNSENFPGFFWNLSEFFWKVSESSQKYFHTFAM